MNQDHPLAPANLPADPVEVRHSTVHGLGAFATRSLQRGHRIGVYTGRRYSPGDAAERDWDNSLTYVFALSDGSCIDGSDGGNATRHLNHSCAPNCAAIELTHDDGRLDIGDDDPADYPCRCGHSRCRGTMAGPAREETGGAAALDTEHVQPA